MYFECRITFLLPCKETNYDYNTCSYKYEEISLIMDQKVTDHSPKKTNAVKFNDDCIFDYF